MLGASRRRPLEEAVVSDENTLTRAYDARNPGVDIPLAQKQERQERHQHRQDRRTHRRTGRTSGVVIPSSAKWPPIKES